MAYIGKAPNTAIVNQATSQSFSGNGSTTAFTLARSVNVGEDLEVFVNNVQQEPGSGKSYTASGTTLTFDEAPPSGTNNVYVIYRGEATINPRLEHDANAALAATTGTFSGAVSGTNGTFSGNLDVDGTTTVDGLTSSEALDVTTSTHANASVFKSTGHTQLFLQDTDASANDQFWGLQVSGGDFNILTCNDDRASGFLTPITIDSSGNAIFAGDIRIGGTGSANALDDYEVGTWTPTPIVTYSSPTLTNVSGQSGSYVRVGKQVSVWFQVTFTSNAAGNIGLSGLPFSVSGSASTCGGARESSQTGVWFQAEGFQSSQFNVLRRYDNGAVNNGQNQMIGFAIYQTS